MTTFDLAHELVHDPVEVGLKIWSKFKERPEHRRPRCEYTVTSDWTMILHHAIGRPLPCQIVQEVEDIWPKVIHRLIDNGITPGPDSYAGHNDGDPAFIRAIWCLVRHLNATKIIETGVAHGVTSRFILEALTRNNNAGRLWSIDLPPQTRPEVHHEIGVAVEYHDAWKYIRGSSRRRLPRLLREIGTLDLFVHDSLHTEYNMLFELRAVWPHIRPGGAVVVDDIDLNWAFFEFAESVHGQSMVCLAEPFRLDPLRLQRNLRGMFGIIVK